MKVKVKVAPLFNKPESHTEVVLVVVCGPVAQFQVTESFTLMLTLEGEKVKIATFGPTVTFVFAAGRLHVVPKIMRLKANLAREIKCCLEFINRRTLP